MLRHRVGDARALAHFRGQHAANFFKFKQHLTDHRESSSVVLNMGGFKNRVEVSIVGPIRVNLRVLGHEKWFSKLRQRLKRNCRAQSEALVALANWSIYVEEEVSRYQAATT